MGKFEGRIEETEKPTMPHAAAPHPRFPALQQLPTEPALAEDFGWVDPKLGGHVFLVIGECGDGKTTLVNALRNPGSPAGDVGKHARGITKDVNIVHGAPLPYCETGGDTLYYDVTFIDMPGVGDMDFTMAELVVAVERVLGAAWMKSGGLDGVIVTTKITDARLRLGAQFVRMLVDKGIVRRAKPDKWENIVLVGTFKDRIEEGDLECFENTIVPEFFKDYEDRTGPWVLTGRGDYEELVSKLAELCHASAPKLEYSEISVQAWSDAFAEVSGLGPDFAKHLDRQRERELEELENLQAEVRLLRMERKLDQEQMSAVLKREQLKLKRSRSQLNEALNQQREDLRAEFEEQRARDEEMEAEKIQEAKKNQARNDRDLLFAAYVMNSLPRNVMKSLPRNNIF